MRSRIPSLLVLLALASPAQASSPTTATLAVDLTDTPRGLFHAVETLPAGPGPLTLEFPRWIPGEHGPTGPIGDLAGLVFEANGKAVSWTRDPIDLFAFNLVLPEGTTSLVARFDYLGAGSSGEYVDGPCSTANLALLSWNHVVLAPRGVRQDAFLVTPSVRLPEGWRYGTALTADAAGSGAAPLGAVAFAPVSLEHLVDSPLTCGRFTREIALAPELLPPHRAFLVADSERALAVPDDLIRQWDQVVRETRAAFGAPHYRRYTFLITLSDAIEHFGLEHHESSDDRMGERALIEPSGRTANALLLTHEFVHSWNGKHRRPADMVPADFSAPLRTGLLWIYEGLTEYYGWVLGARAGTLDAKAARDDLARTGAALDARAGRRWRTLLDTAVAASLLNTAPGAWASWRRGQDYYDEGTLIWLEADTRIRALTHGRKSLDDFTRAFFGGEVAGPPVVVPYTLNDVTQALSRVAPDDWANFFALRVDSLQVHAPLAGIEAAGFRLAFRDSSSDYFDALDADAERTDYRFSLGFRVGQGGKVSDVLPDSPAARAGLPPGATLVAVEGRKWSKDVLDDALDATRPVEADPAKALAAGPRGKTSLELLAATGDFYRTYRTEYAGGPKVPYLERRKATPDLLGRITAPRAAREARR